nr:hypothetical protein [Actinomyces sp.]
MVTKTADTATTVVERELRVAEAIHGSEMEGLPVGAAFREDAQEYVAGRIDSDELVARARTLWPRLSSLTRTSTQRRVC